MVEAFFGLHLIAAQRLAVWLNRVYAQKSCLEAVVKKTHSHINKGTYDEYKTISSRSSCCFCFCEFRTVSYSGSCAEQVADCAQSMLVFVLPLKLQLESKLYFFCFAKVSFEPCCIRFQGLFEFKLASRNGRPKFLRR